MKQQVDAKKKTLQKKEALELLRQVDEVFAAKGKNLVHVNLKKDPADLEAVVPLLLGPTGNLRAPTVKKGRTLVVGFDEATYRKIFGQGRPG